MSDLTNTKKFEVAKASEVFQPFEVTLSEMKNINEKTVFEYETPSGNKAARSHIYKLRQSKSAITKAHKDAKADALEYGRKLDGEKKRLIGEIDGMIEVHEKPLKEIEEREQQRKDAILQRIHDIANMGVPMEGHTSASLEEVNAELLATEIDDSFMEFKEQALVAKDTALTRIASQIKSAKDAEELARLREQQRIEDQKKRDAEIAEQAKAQAEREAQEKIEEQRRLAKEAELRARQAELDRAEAERKAKERREQELKQAELDKQAAVERARQEEIRKQQEAEAKAKDDKEAREANIAHMSKIMREAKESYMQAGYSEEEAKKLVLLVSKGKIANVTINY